MYNFSVPSEFERMYEDYFPKIYNYVFYRLLHKETTEDIVSHIFLKVAQNIFIFDSSKASFNTWIYIIAHNILTDYYRVKKNEISIDNENYNLKDTLSITFDEQYKKIMSSDRKALYKALTKLPEKQRILISLKYFNGITNREISKMTGINESTVSTLILRGVAELKSIVNIE